MKSVSWRFAFCKLNEWREKEWPISFGPVGDVESQGETITMFSGSSGTRVLNADEATGIVTLFGEGDINLHSASFRFSGFEDSPFNEADLGPEEFASSLEATLPDGRILVFAREWEVKL
jgi:hypothetical protein